MEEEELNLLDPATGEPIPQKPDVIAEEPVDAVKIEDETALKETPEENTLPNQIANIFRKTGKDVLGLQTKLTSEPDLVYDPLLKKVAKRRDSFNQEGRKSPYVTDDGEFDVDGATYDAFQTLTDEQKQYIDREEMTGVIEEKLEDVGAYYTFDYDTPGSDKILTPRFKSSKRSAVTAVGEGVRAGVKGGFELAEIAVGLTGEVLDLFNTKSEMKMFLDDQRKYQNYPKIGTRVAAGEYGTKPLSQEEQKLYGALAQFSVKRKITEKDKNNMLSQMYFRLPDNIKDGIGDIDDYEDVLGLNKFGGPLSGVVEGIGKAQDSLGAIGLGDQISVEFNLEGNLDRGERDAANIIAEFVTSMSWFDDIPKYFLGKSLKEATERNIARGTIKGSNDGIIDLDTYTFNYIKENLSDAPGFDRTVSYLFAPLLRQGMLMGYDGAGTKITKARALQYMSDNPSLVKPILTYTAIGGIMADFIESTANEQRYDFMGVDLLSVSSSSIENNPIASTVGTIAAFITAPTTAHLLWNTNTVGSSLNLLRVLPRKLSGNNEGLDKVIEFWSTPIDELMAGRAGISSEYYKSLSPTEREATDRLLKDKASRNFIINMVTAMRRNRNETPELYAAGKAHFFEMLDLMDNVAGRLREIIDPATGKPKYEEDLIKSITELSFGEILGMPLIKGLEQNLASGGSSVALSPGGNPASAIINQNDKATMLSASKDKSARTALVLNMVLSDIVKAEGFDSTSLVNQNIITLRNWARVTVEENAKQIDEKGYIVKGLESNNNGGNLANDLPRVEQEVKAGMDVDESIMSFNGDEYIETGRADPRLVPDEKTNKITSTQRYNATVETEGNTKIIMNYILDRLVDTKSGLYDEAFTIKGKELILSKKQFNTLLTNFRDNKAQATGNAGGELTPRHSYFARKDVNEGRTIQDTFNPENVTEALKDFDSQASKRIKVLEAKREIATDKTQINKINKEIKKIETQKGIVNTRLQNNDSVINNRELTNMFGDKTYSFFNYEYFKFQDINRERGLLAQSVSKRQAKDINKITDLDAFDYIMNNVTELFSEVPENLQMANDYFKNNVAPIIKSKTGNKYIQNQNVGQSLMDEKDVLLNLLNDMEGDVFVNIINQVIKESIVADVPLNLNKYDNGIKTDEIYKADLGESITKVILERLAIKKLLDKGDSSYQNLQETLEAIERNADWMPSGTYAKIKALEKDGPKKIEVSEYEKSLEKIEQRSTDREITRDMRDLDRSFAGMAEPSASTQELIKALNLEGVDLSEVNLQVGAEFTTIADQIKNLEGPQKEAARFSIYKGLIDEYFDFQTGGMKMATIKSGGESFQVPAIFEVMRKNGEVIADLIGPKGVDDLAFLTQFHTAMVNSVAKPALDMSEKTRFDLRNITDVNESIKMPTIKEQVRPMSKLNVEEQLYYQQFAPEGNRVGYAGVSPESTSQVLGSRFYNMARGFVSPQFVAIEFYIKSLPQGQVKLIENMLQQGPEAAGVFKDMFFDGNYSAGIGVKRRLTNMTFAVAINGAADPMGFNEEDSIVDFSAFRTKDGAELSQEQKQQLALELIDHVASISDEELIAFLESGELQREAS